MGHHEFLNCLAAAHYAVEAVTQLRKRQAGAKYSVPESFAETLDKASRRLLRLDANPAVVEFSSAQELPEYMLGLLQEAYDTTFGGSRGFKERASHLCDLAARLRTPVGMQQQDEEIILFCDKITRTALERIDKGRLAERAV